MFNWFKKTPKVEETIQKEAEITESKYKHCDIEYLPISGLYYPRYKGKYIMYWTYGAYTLESIHHGKSFYTEKEAREFLDRYLETRGWGTKLINLE